MDETDARAMRDQHSRDEAEMRRVQQLSAGAGHAPVEDYPQHGAHPAAGGWCAGTSATEYESALAREAAAWERVKQNMEGPHFHEVWSAWRTAVEDRDKATRMLINHSL
jgi:hypothetical protein